MDDIPVTTNFSQDIDSVIGYINFNKNSEIFKKFMKNPAGYVFASSYIINEQLEDGTILDADLIELSLISTDNIKK